MWLRRLYTTPGGRDLVAMDSRRRVFPALLRRMLVLRDDVCTTPWCQAPIVHADHTTPVRRCGPHRWGNGDGKCARCNAVKEAPGWPCPTVIHPGPRPRATRAGSPTPSATRSRSRSADPRKRRRRGPTARRSDGPPPPDRPGGSTPGDRGEHPDRAPVPRPGTPTDRVGLGSTRPTEGTPHRAPGFERHLVLRLLAAA